MATYTWTLQGTSPTVIDATDIIQFAGAAFNNALFVGNYQDSIHVKTSLGVNRSLGNVPHNTKYVTSTTMSLDGASAVNLNDASLTTATAPLKINFSHGSSVAITNHILYAYNGSVTTTPPVEVNFKCAERGNTTWVSAGGSAAALALADHAAATSHDFYVLLSASPTAVGTKNSFVIRDELIYS